MECVSLDKVNLGENCIVTEISINDSHNFRIYDIGIVKGSAITPLFKSMFGDTFAFRIKGSVIALRKDCCKNIKVKLL